MGLAKRDYVSATIDYRLGIIKPKSDTIYFEAMYRAVQDAKAAVRFLKKMEISMELKQLKYLLWENRLLLKQQCTWHI